MKTAKAFGLLLLTLCSTLPTPQAGAQGQPQQNPPVPQAPLSEMERLKQEVSPNIGFFRHGPGPALLPGGNVTLYYVKPRVDTSAADQARFDTVRRGEALMKAGDSDGAIGAFQQSLAAEPRDGLALQRLAEAYTARGRADQALATYRRLVYRVPGQNWGSSGAADPAVLMHFALLLLKTGQGAEALTIYHRAVYFLDYDMGRPNPSVPVPVPDLGDGPGQVPYTPQTLRAMGQLALGIETFGHLGPFDPEPLAHFRQAVQLAPDSAAAYYYLGKYLVGNDNAAARVALEKAIQLGDEQTAREANVYLKMAR